MPILFYVKRSGQCIFIKKWKKKCMLFDCLKFFTFIAVQSMAHAFPNNMMHNRKIGTNESVREILCL